MFSLLGLQADEIQAVRQLVKFDGIEVDINTQHFLANNVEQLNLKDVLAFNASKNLSFSFKEGSE